MEFIISCILIVLILITVLLTFGFLLSLFGGIRAKFKLLLSGKNKIYAFSDCSIHSLKLARSINNNCSKNGVKPLFIFFESEASPDESLNAIAVNKKITLCGKMLVRSSAAPVIFICGMDEHKNLYDSVQLIENLGACVKPCGADLIVLTSLTEAEPVLNSTPKNGIRVRRIDKYRTFIYNHFYNTPVYDYANDEKEINVLISGFGEYGRELLRALVWTSQGDGYRLNAHVMGGEDSRVEFKARYPELFDTHRLNDSADINYKIEFIQGTVYDLERLPSDSFCDRLTLAFISSDNDEKSLGEALFLRGFFERKGIKPAVQVLLTAADCFEMKTHKGKSYDIGILTTDSLFEENALINYGLEETAKRIFSPWNKAHDDSRYSDFYDFEFNYRSSMASALFWSVRKRHCESIEVNEENMRLEHRRWNAYMRTEGYRYAPVRNDIAKEHPCLVSYDGLTEEEQGYDANPIKSVIDL